MAPILKVLLRRLALGALTLLIVSAMIFLAVELLPGDIATETLGQSATPESLAALREKLISEGFSALKIRLRLPDANDRELYERLLERFVAAVEASGAEMPEDEEARMQQLDLVLVRRGLARSRGQAADAIKAGPWLATTRPWRSTRCRLGCSSWRSRPPNRSARASTAWTSRKATAAWP